MPAIKNWALAFAASVCLATAAYAQDYTVTTVSGRYVTPPQGATDLGLGLNGKKEVDLPFRFPYFGTVYDTVRVTAYGAVEFGPEASSGAARICAPFATGLDPSAGGKVVHWTSGGGSQRVFHVGWIEIPGSSGPGKPSFELELHENGAKIVFAYAPVVNPSDWSPFGGFLYALNIRAEAARPNDARFVVPDPKHAIGHPGTDYEMTPVTVRYSGSLSYDQLVVDASGIGTSVKRDVPLAGLIAALTYSNGDIAVAERVAASGAFLLTTAGLDSEDRGDLTLFVETEGARVVRNPKGRVWALSPLAKLDFSSGAHVGTISLGDRDDADGTVRSVLHTALTLERAHAWAAARTEVELPRIEAVVNGDLSFDTGIVPAAGQSEAFYFVAGGPTTPPVPTAQLATTGSTSPDTWDDDVIVRLYSRWLLSAIAAPQSTEPVDVFDAVSDEENAFALGFGHYLAAVLSGSTDFVDGVDDESAVVIDVEDPTLDSPAGADVAGRVAASLIDLLDGANEPHDGVDGTAVPAAVFQVVDSLDAPPTVERFLAAWGALGHDGPAAARILIHNQALEDDGAEFDDVSAARRDVGEVGVRVDGRVLNPYNEDWYEVTLGLPNGALAPLVATVKANAATGVEDVTLEVRDLAGVLLGAQTGSIPPGGALTTLTSPVGPGRYQVRVGNAGGVRLSDYSLQVHRPFVAQVSDLPDWTEDRPYTFGFEVDGGILPYAAELGSGDSMPPGLVLDEGLRQVRGTPILPGRYVFAIRFADAGNPTNHFTLLQDVVIHEGLRFDLPRFVPFPLGREHTFAPARSGGTTPYVFALTDGDLPPGIALDSGALLLEGMALAAGSWDVRLDGVDVAGSSHTSSARAIVAVAADAPKTPVGLAEGDASLGLFVDAVAGSRLKFSAKTARRMPVRTLDEPVVLASDGSEVLGGKRKGKQGRASASRVIVPASGRFFVVTGSDAGPATGLLGTVKVVAPKQASGVFEDVTPGEALDLSFGALEGARVTLVVRRSRKSDLDLRPQILVGPDDQTIDLAGKVKESKTGFKVTAEIPAGGTWRLRVGVVSGAPGSVKYKAKIKQPKGAVFIID